MVANARAIADAEGAVRGVGATAAPLHELFNHPKGHPGSHRSGEVCAEHARALLREQDAVRIEGLGVRPTTLEARVPAWWW